MPKFPKPPGVNALRDIPPDITTLSAGDTVFRIVFTGGSHPAAWDAFRYFGPTASRFDHHICDASGGPHNQDRGIMYLAHGKEAVPTCLAEVFQTSRVVDRHSRQPVLAAFALAEEVRLLNLTGYYPTRIGASMVINGGPRPRAREWAQQLYEAHPDIDGLLYASSMNGNQPAIALFERAQRAIPDTPLLHKPLVDTAFVSMLVSTAALFGYDLV